MLSIWVGLNLCHFVMGEQCIFFLLHIVIAFCPYLQLRNIVKKNYVYFVVDALYSAMSECQALHPDPEDEDSEEEGKRIFLCPRIERSGAYCFTVVCLSAQT